MARAIDVVQVKAEIAEHKNGRGMPSAIQQKKSLQQLP